MPMEPGHTRRFRGRALVVRGVARNMTLIFQCCCRSPELVSSSGRLLEDWGSDWGEHDGQGRVHIATFCDFGCFVFREITFSHLIGCTGRLTVSAKATQKYVAPAWRAMTWNGIVGA
jgi:hypothetical protein